MPDRYQGRSLSRLEDARFLTGRGTYVANHVPPGCLHLHVVRSPHGHARIRSIESPGRTPWVAIASIDAAPASA